MTTAVAGRRRLFLIFCCIALVSAFVIRSGTHVAARGTQEPASRAGSGERTADCGASPAPPSSAAGWRSWIAACAGWTETAVPAPIATCRPTISSCRRRASKQRFRLLSLLPPIQSGCGRSALPADRRRRLPHQRRERQRFQQSAAERAHPDQLSTLPPQIRLIDPVTNQLSSETSVDVWRMVPTVNDVKLTGDDGENPWPRGPNTTGGYQLDARFARPSGAGDWPPSRRTPRFRTLPPQRLLDDLAAFQRVSVHERARARAFRRDQRRHLPLPDPDPPLNELETAGQGRLRARLQLSATAVRGNRPRRFRSFDTTTS